MLLIQYGMQGSASSWAFRLCQRIAEAMGSDQAGLLAQSNAGSVPWSAIAGAPLGGPHPNPWDVEAVAKSIPANQILVMKTHSAPHTGLGELMRTGRVNSPKPVCGAL